MEQLLERSFDSYGLIFHHNGKFTINKRSNGDLKRNNPILVIVCISFFAIIFSSWRHGTCDIIMFSFFFISYLKVHTALCHLHPEYSIASDLQKEQI